jgi:hypothetical protein
MKNMIKLTQDHLIGKGRTRFCYRHPDDSGKCIKIDKRAPGGATEKEALYYQKLGRFRPNLAYTHIPRFYGFVETSLGRGGVFDLIRDEDTGEISKSLSHYIRTGEAAVDNPLWLEAHRAYMKTLYEEAVIIRDFNPGNLCARRMRDGSYQLVSIDGIGHRDFIPLCDCFPWFARRKLRRHVRLKNFTSLEDILRRLARKPGKQMSAAPGDGS